MVDLNSPVWGEMQSENVPPFLRELAENPEGNFWDLIDDVLVDDQGDVLDAAYAAFPHLVEIASARPIPEQVELWEFIGHVVAQCPRAPSILPQEVRNDYETSLSVAKARILGAICARALDEKKTISLIQSLAAVSGSYGPGRILEEVLGADFLEVQCPQCKRLLRITVQGDGRSLRILAKLTGRVLQKDPLPLPGNSSEGTPALEEIIPSNCNAWLPLVAEAGGCRRAAQLVRTLSQDVPCPECNSSFPLMEELYRDATINLDESGLDSAPQEELGPRDNEAIQRQIEEHTAQVDFFYKLEKLPKPEVIRILLAIAELELYEGAFSAQILSNAEVALAAARDWLKKPTPAHEEKARLAGSQALKLIAGAAATACGRMPELAAKTCVDALMGLPPELRYMAIARIREIMGKP